MKFIQSIMLTFIILVLMLVESVNAQQNLAQQAYAIFEQSCVICHGENGSYRESLIIEHTALIDDAKVIPGNPDGSILYQRLIETDVAKRMPLAQPPLAPEAIETIRQWILAGAPDWNAVPKPKPDFITNRTIFETIENHVNSLSSRDRAFARYFTLTHLYNAGETTEALNAYRRALSKLINSLSWGREVVNPTPIDVEQTIFYIDLRDYEWDVRNDAWTQIEQAYPYKMTFDAPTQTDLLEKLTTLQQEMSCEVPFVHVDWFLATASLPPLYHDILALPKTDRELEAELKVSVAENLLNAPGRRVWRAGFNDSGVSRHNRVVERHTSSYGAYWKSYDFAGSAESQNIFTHPLDFTHDGGEIIFNLPNGLQAYYLVDANGNRLDAAPISIVRNPAASDPTVRNGLSCIGCHTEGMKTFEDTVRAVVEKATNPPYDKVKALDLYVQKTVMDALVAEDTQRFQVALKKTGGVFGGIEPVQRFHEAFQGTLSAAHAAAAVGLETDVFLQKISQNVSLQNLGLQVLTNEGGNVKRDAWTSNFDDMISALNSPDSVLPRPEPIPGASVHIPDANLRATLNKMLDKPADAPITIAEMKSFIGFGVHNTHRQINGSTQIIQETLNNKGIENLTGLEYAINIQELSISDEGISDLSPISELIKLHELRLHFTSVSDLTPISGLTKIRVFVFENCPKISDLSPIAGFTELETIQAGHNFKISDLSPLAGKEKLKSILLWGPPVKDLSPLANLPNIEYIDMCGNEISVIPSFENAPKLKKLYIFDNDVSDISILQNLKGLERLNLRNNKITDISPLAELTNLKWLDLTHNPISDFSPLAELSQNTNIIAGSVNIPDRNLRAAIVEALGKDGTGVVAINFEEITTLQRLYAENKNISDLTGLEFAKNLTALYLTHNALSDISPLGALTKLREVGIAQNPLSDISPLASLTKLRQVRLNDTEVADLSPLASLHDLEEINVAATRISSLAPLAGLKNLKKLDTIHSDISDLSPLAGLTNLTRLLLYDCKATDLSPLKNLTKLRWLGFPHTNNITDFSPLSGLTELRHLDLFHTEISDLSPLAGLVNMETLILSYNQIVDVSPLASLPNLKRLELHVNNISDFSPLNQIREHIEVFIWYDNPGFPQGGPKIEGPWLWLTLPIKVDGTGQFTDHLAEASDNKVTEEQIATLGATQGTVVGNNVWTIGSLEPYNTNHLYSNVRNLERLLNAHESIEFDSEGKFVVYGSMIVYSPKTQHTKIFIGSSYARKVYLNSELVHENHSRHSSGEHTRSYQSFFPIMLQPGKNVLLVKLRKNIEGSVLWSLFFGFEEGTEYTVAHPGVGISFSATETNLLAGDTFTLNLNAENITDLAGWQTDIAFDPNVLEAVEVTEGDFLKSEGGDTFFQSGTIDNTEGKITNLFSTRIAESGSSGIGALLSVTFKAKAGGKTHITLENFEFISTSGAIIPTVHPNITITVGEYPAWDVNQDGRVSIQDLVLVANDLGSGTPANLRTDINRDGVINIQDLILVAQHMGETTDSAAPIVALDSNELTPAMVQTWIEQAQVEDDGSIVFRQGIENLQRLLASLLPEKTALLANYPNPFNPETWVPYHLAKPADITLTIYAANGAVVRTLALGHQAAGIYQSRSRAAHWNGRNDVGESVASGIYFYTLTADDFTSTRKMLIRK